MSVTCHHFTPGHRAPLPDVPTALTRLEADGFVWFDFQDPSAEDLAPLVGPLGIHPLSLEDCFDSHQIPKVEDFRTYLFALFNTCGYLDGRAVTDEVDLFLGARFLVTVRGHDAKNPAFFDGFEQSVERNLPHASQGPDHLMHVLLDFVTDRKFATIEAMQETVEAAEAQVMADPAAFRPETLLRVRSDLVELRKSLFHERENLVRICRRDSPFISERSLPGWRDVYDHLSRFYEFIEITRERVSTLMELYLALQNNQLAEASNQTNLVMKRLTLINTIFMPLTLLAGIGGMSEWSMITGPENWPWTYPAFLGLMVLLGLTNWGLMKWARWV